MSENTNQLNTTDIPPHDLPTSLAVPGNIQQTTNVSYNNHGPHCASCQHLASTEITRNRNRTMSPIRRFFCLFVTFDLLLTCLIWLITLVLTGEFNFYTVIHKEILHYTIRTSSFDIVMASAARFIILLLFYALLRLNHWIIVAITTASTCFFLVAKVCLFDWDTTGNQVLQVMLILSSFILSWSEAWLLDIRVIPNERNAENATTNFDERTPLLRNYPNIHSRLDALSESIYSFYSPAESSEDSADEFERIAHRKIRTAKPCSTNENYHAKGEEILEAAWQVLNNDKWVFEKDTAEGDTIYSQKTGKGQKIFRLIGKLNIPSTALQELLFNKIEDFPKWNPTVKEAKIVQVMDSCTDITSQISAEVGNGLIACREFVTLRFCKPKYGCIIIASASITWPPVSSDTSLIRGENGPGCWAIRSVSEDSCEVRWLLNTKINGWLPQYAVDSALAGVMTDYMSYLRKYTSSNTIITNLENETNSEEHLVNNREIIK
ncbi:steroidogenic acute regulatory protein-like [Rhodnius prolixus]|uniref:steroidogenic acute regulatory protein-like n=1 Tax=Rhodnius prolixus TaxID=13249 RepID=UPI003D187BAA